MKGEEGGFKMRTLVSLGGRVVVEVMAMAMGAMVLFCFD